MSDATFLKQCEIIGDLTQERDDYKQSLEKMTEYHDAVVEERDQLRASLREIDEAVHSHIDGRDLIDELCPSGWHHCDIVVRINGQYKRYEGDWLKRLWYALRKYRAIPKS